MKPIYWVWRKKTMWKKILIALLLGLVAVALAFRVQAIRNIVLGNA